MRTLLLKIWHRIVVLVGLGAVLVSVSEYWFYEVDAEVDSLMILLAYGLLGFLFIAVLQRFRVRSLAGLVVASALLGFLIEGVPVPVVYSNPPLTIVWTSLAWHALFTVGLGWLLVRIVLTDHSTWRAVSLNAGLGITFGAWNAFMWNAHEVEGSPEFMFSWQPTEVFGAQFLYGYGLFLGGHILLDRCYPKGFAVNRIEYFSLWVLAGAFSVFVAYGHGLLALFPVLPGLVLVCLVALQKESRTNAGADGTIIDRLYVAQMPIWRFGLTLLIPIFAIPTYAVLVHYELEIEMNLLMIVTAGPLAAGAFLWSLVRISTRSKEAA